MAWLIMNDEVDYESAWYPTHIISKYGKLLPLFIGATQTLVKGMHLVGLWVKDEHYTLINHKKAYVLVHDPDAVDDDVSVDWDKISDAEDAGSVSRAHVHLWKEIEWEGKEKKQ